MKKRSILLSVLIFTALLVSVLAVLVFAETEPGYTGTVTEAEAKLTEAEAISGDDAKGEALIAVAEYIKTVDPTAENYAGLCTKASTAYAAFIKSVTEGYNANGTILARSVQLKKISRYIKNLPVAEGTEGFADTVTAYTNAKAVHDEDMAKARAQLAFYAGPGEERWNDVWYNNYDGLANKELSVGNETSPSFAGKETGMDGDNGYYTVRYRAQAHTHVTITHESFEKDLVYEFDFTTFDHLPSASMSCETGTLTWPNGDKKGFAYFNIASDGTVKCGGSSVKAIVPGEWTHFIMTVNVTTGLVRLYADYQLVGEFEGTYEGYVFEPKHVRFGSLFTETGPTANGEYSIDNISVYQGTTVRDKGAMDSMTAEEKFIHWVKYVQNDVPSIANRLLAHAEAERMLPTYYDKESSNYLTDNAEVRAAVDQFLAFSKDEMVQTYKDNNLESLLSLVDELSSLNRTPETYASRATAVSKIEKFLNDNNEYITKNEDYNNAFTTLTRIKAELAEEDAIDEFVLTISSFKSSTNINNIRLQYEKACELEKTLNKELLTSDFPKFVAAYEEFLAGEEYLQDKVDISNSERLIATVRYLDNFPTEEDMEANYDMLLSFVESCLDIIESGDYDPYISGCPEAVKSFEKFEKYFTDRRNAEQIAYFTERIERIKASNRYMERYGLCKQLIDYSESNRIDEDCEELMALINEANELYEVIVSEKDSYGELLAENTTAFLALMEKAKTVKGLTELEKVIDEATALSFMIDTTAEGAEEAVQLLEELTAEAKETREITDSFTDSVLLLIVYEEDDGLLSTEVFGQLGVCSAKTEGVDFTVEEAKAALENYKSVLEDYLELIGAAAEEQISITKAAAGTQSKAATDSFGGVIAEMSKSTEEAGS